MILFLIFNALIILTRSQTISICKDAICSIGCKTYQAPICISDYTDNLYVNSKQIVFFTDSVCSTPFLNITYPLLIDNKCHSVNNIHYLVPIRGDNTILLILPIFLLLILGLLYKCPRENSQASLNQNPPMRD
jgi:hypothetical protein